MERRVVITGLGAITPIGNNVDETWKGIENKECGIDKISLFDSSNFKTSLCAEVKNYNPLDYFEPKQAKRLDRSSQFALIAAREAVKNSGITSENTDFKKVGIFVSTGIGGLITIQNQCEINYEKGNNRVSPMFIPMAIANMPAGNISIEFGFKGESMAIVTACSSSTHAIGEGYKTIKHGYEDVVVAGGTEASICSIGIAGFENMKALCTSTDKNRASIPSDAYHITSPCPDGEGGANAMIRAMKDAKIKPENIDYINAHGTSTHLNDLTETMAIKTALGKASKTVMISSTKGNIGHLLGAAGAVEAILSVKAMENELVPPTINYKEKDEECDLDIVPNKPRKAKLNIVMSNSLGFGGHNSSIILKKWEEE